MNFQDFLFVWLMEDRRLFKKPVISAIPFGDTNGTEIIHFKFKTLKKIIEINLLVHLWKRHIDEIEQEIHKGVTSLEKYI